MSELWVVNNGSIFVGLMIKLIFFFCIQTKVFLVREELRSVALSKTTFSYGLSAWNDSDSMVNREVKPISSHVLLSIADMEISVGLSVSFAFYLVKLRALTLSLQSYQPGYFLIP